MDPVARELTDVPIRRGNPPNVLDSAELSLTVSAYGRERRDPVVAVCDIEITLPLP